MHLHDKLQTKHYPLGGGGHSITITPTPIATIPITFEVIIIDRPNLVLRKRYFNNDN